MRIAFTQTTRPIAFALAAVLLTACGGGGSDGDELTTIRRPANAAPLQISADQEVPAMALTLSLAESLIVLGHQSKVWHEAVAVTKSASSVIACATGGTRDVQWRDLDGDRTVSAGDTVSVLLSDCLVESTAVRFSGSMSWLVQSSSPEQVSLQVALENLTYTRNTTTSAWSGGLLVQATRDDAGDSLRVAHVALKPMVATASFVLPNPDTGKPSLFVANEFIPSFELRKERLMDRGGSRSQLSMTLHSGIMNGAVQLETPTPYFALANSYPSRGEYRLTGEAGSVMSLVHGNGYNLPRLSAPSLVPHYPKWETMMLGYLWWYDGDLPEAYSRITFIDRSTPIRLVTLMPLQVRNGQAFFVVTFNRVPEPYCGRVKMWRRDSSTIIDVGPGAWPNTVNATVETVGATVILRPSELLKPGATYYATLGSGDNTCVTIDPPSAINNPGGTSADRVDGWTLSFTVADDPMVSISANRALAVLPDLALTVDASSSSSVQGPLAFAWSASAAPDVRIVNGDTSRATFNVPFQAGAAPYRTQIEVVGTSANGNAGRARVAAMVAPDPTRATLLSLQSTLGDGVFNGLSGLMVSDTPADVRVRTGDGRAFLIVNADYNAQGLSAVWMNFSFPMADLVPGVYDVKPLVGTATASSPTVARVYWFGNARGIECSDLSGEVTVSDATKAAEDEPPFAGDRRVTSLALEFALRCDAGGDVFKGSFRHLSVTPLKLVTP